MASVKKQGRTPAPINWTLVDNLLEAGCTGTEIASHFNVCHDTFYRRIEQEYNVSFTEYSAQKKAKGNSILRAAQYAKALGQTTKGDNTLLIWLGKNRLDQKETHDVPTAPNDIKIDALLLDIKETKDYLKKLTAEQRENFQIPTQDKEEDEIRRDD